MEINQKELIDTFLFNEVEEVCIEDIIGLHRPTAIVPQEQLPLNTPVAFNVNREEEQTNLYFLKEENWECKVKEYLIQLQKRLKRKIGVQEGYLMYLEGVGEIEFDNFLFIFNECENENRLNYKMELCSLLNGLKDKAEPFVESRVDCKVKTGVCEMVSNDKVCLRHFYKDALLSQLCLKCNLRKAKWFNIDLNFLCSDCYDRNAGDHFFIEITDCFIKNLWSKQEEYYLLKGIELCGDDWDTVAKTVNCIYKEGEEQFWKSKESCIVHFILMPIIETIEEFPILPFYSFENRVTTLCAFLSTQVSSQLAAKLSKHTLKQLKKLHDKEIELSHDELLADLLENSQMFAREIAEVEKLKITRLKEVRCEARLVLLELKMNTLNNLEEENLKTAKSVKKSLEELKIIVMNEISKKTLENKK